MFSSWFVRPRDAASQFSAEPGPGLDATVEILFKATSNITESFINDRVRSTVGFEGKIQ